MIPINTIFAEILDGMSTIRAYRSVDKLFNNFANKLESFTNAGNLRNKIDARIIFIIFFASNVLVIIHFFYLFYFE